MSIRIIRLFVLFAVCLPLAAFAGESAPADSTYFALEAEGVSLGWMSVRRTEAESGNALYAGSGVLRGTTTLSWTLELTADLARLIRIGSVIKSEVMEVSSDIRFKEKGGKPDLETVFNGQRFPQEAEDLKAGAVLFPSIVPTVLAPLSDRLSGMDPRDLDIKLHATDGQRALLLHVEGQPATRVVVRGEEVPVRAFLLTATHKGDEPAELRLYQRPDGSFFGVAIQGMTMFAVGGAEMEPMPRDYPRFVTSGGDSLLAVLTLPPEPEDGAATPGPAVLMIAGPGQQGMDAQSAGFSLFAHLADALARGGVTCLRYAPRDSVSGPDVMSTLAADAVAALEVLRASSLVDGAKVVLLGHGEGAMLLGEVAAAAAAAGAPVSGLISLGGVTVPGTELQAVSPRPADAPWLESFLAYDPRTHLVELGLPMLLVHGELDAEVPPDNAAGLKTFLNEAGHMRVSCTVARNMNHWLQKAKTGAVEEYPDLEPACADGIAKRVTSFVGYSTR